MTAKSPAPTRIQTVTAYDEAFAKYRTAALERAHDIRKFEIELYWKRAAYFWAFTAVALAGYFSTGSPPERTNTFIICCLGFLFSFSWYLVNRGSSYWQRNWEKHVDLLENESEGPLHKMVINREQFDLTDFSGPYRFSPARTNTMLSLMFILLWMGLAARTLLPDRLQPDFRQAAAFFGILTAVTAFEMVRQGSTGRAKQRREIDFVVRGFTSNEPEAGNAAHVGGSCSPVRDGDSVPANCPAPGESPPMRSATPSVPRP